MQDSLHVLHSRPPHHFLRYPRMSAESLLDSQAAWTTLEFVHVPLWLDWWVQVCDGHSEMPSQVQEGREAIERVPVR